MVSPASIDTRAAQLLTYSDRVYDAIDQRIGDETRARRLLRIGIQAVAYNLHHTSIDQAGMQFNRLLHGQLVAGGCLKPDLAPWPRYQKLVESLPSQQPTPWHHELDDFSVRYADVLRGTIDRAGNYESDASHAIHLAALAVPYATTYYQDLNPHKVGVYSLLHDAPEAYAGDTPTLGASEATLARKAIIEAEAMGKIETEFGDEFPQFVSTIEDYEALADDEARFVKTFDKLDPKFTYAYSGGLALVRDYGYTRTRFQRETMAQRRKLRNSYGREFPDVVNLHAALTRRGTQSIEWPSKQSAS